LNIEGEHGAFQDNRTRLRRALHAAHNQRLARPMKTVVLCGPESSGKSGLAARLQTRFGGLVVNEYVRTFIEQHQRDTTYADISLIARGQLAAEDAARHSSPELLILDTHLLSNRLWSLTLFGDCPAWLEPALQARHYDLHLVLSPEGAEWIADGQRCQPDLNQRRQFFQATLDWLIAHGYRYQIIEGDWSARETAAAKAVARLMER